MLCCIVVRMIGRAVQSTSLTPTCALLMRNSRGKLLMEKKLVQNPFPSSASCYKLLFIYPLPLSFYLSLSFLLPPPLPFSPPPFNLPLSLSLSLFPPSFSSTPLYLLDFSDQLGRPVQCGFKAEPEEYEMVCYQWVLYPHEKQSNANLVVLL